MKSLDDMKSDFTSFKFSAKHLTQNDEIGAGEEHAGFRSVIDSVKGQDRKDERYILHKKVLPVALGIILLTLLATFLHFPNQLILAGFVLVYMGLVSILILFLRDYRNISNEAFDQTLMDYLVAKRKRLVNWKRIPVLYNVIYGLYIIGVLLIIIGNTTLASYLGSSFGNLIYMVGIISALIISGIVGEYRFRKRHQRMQEPIIERIDSLMTELRANGDLA
jgi:hypothetical protein